jgi:PAS domain S-box-containing protein
MDNALASQCGSETLSGSLVGHGFALLCWVLMIILVHTAWRRRRENDVSNLLIIGGAWLAIRLGLLIVGLPGVTWPGDNWFAAALDLTGLMLLAWPFLAPPLSARWADRVAGIGLVIVALMYSVTPWLWIRGTLGLPPTRLQLTVTWAYSALTLAGLAALNLLPYFNIQIPAIQRRRTEAHDEAGKREWLLTGAGALLIGIIGLCIPLPAVPSLSSALTAITATFAAAWLNRLERPRPSVSPPTLPEEARENRMNLIHLMTLSTSLFAAPDSAQFVKATTSALRSIVEVQSLALCLVENEKSASPLHLRLVARWPQTINQEVIPPFTLKSIPVLANALTWGKATKVPQTSNEQRQELLDHLLGSKPKAALILPLLAPPSREGLREALGILILGHNDSPLCIHQLELCDILADQVAIATRYLQLRAKIGQQAQSLACLIRRQGQETGQLHAVLESIADGVIVSDSSGRVLLSNNAALNILGSERPDIIGQSFGQVIGRIAPADDMGITETLGSASAWSKETTSRISDRIVQTRIAPVEDGQGAHRGMVAVLRDTTAQTKAEVEREHLLTELQEHSQQLEEAAAQLRELDRLKSQFIFNMSHELRTPLNHIIGFSGVMLKEIDGPLTDIQRQDLEAIHKGGKHLLELINSVLDVSHILAGKMELTLSDISLPNLVEDAMNIASTTIQDKSIELTHTLNPDMPTIRADKTRVRQVLINLLTNAIKYTEQGRVTVSASRDNGSIIISVTDTGIGIPPECIKAIFEEFGRVDNSSTRKVDGLGLGLSISRRLVELHGGKLWVESEVGVGSTFYFSLPINADSLPTAANKKIARQQLAAALAKWEEL